jgi:putative flippase GtrA
MVPHRLKMAATFCAANELTRFIIVGLINTSVTLSLIFFLSDLLGMNYLVANGIGFVGGFLNSFVMNRFWTFRSSGRILDEWIWFFVVFVISYFIQLKSFLFFQRLEVFSLLWAQISAMIVFTLLNFSGNKLITFKKEGK